MLFSHQTEIKKIRFKRVGEMGSPSATPEEFEKIFLSVQDFLEKGEEILIGQPEVIKSLLIVLLAQGNSLIESVPGLGKTRAIKLLSRLLGLKFSRIQFTPDLIPSDITGNLIYNPQKSEFSTKFGPLFAQIILADEINRAPAKVQSALLEAMEEKQVTIGEETYPLPRPFIVFATQNPIEDQGTYPLPEAQLDRFLLKISLSYPPLEEEQKMLSELIQKPLPKKEREFPLLEAGKITEQIHLSEEILSYITRLVRATRPENNRKLEKIVVQGCSPRATYHLGLASQANALIHQRTFVAPEDIKEIASSVLAHRLILNYASETKEEILIQEILRETPAP